MAKRPHTMQAYYCDNPDCRALLALLQADALQYDTRLRCACCSRISKLRKLKIDSARAADYTDSQLAPA